MNSNVLGIDIGGTKIEGVIFDGKKIVKRLEIVTPKTLPEFKNSLAHMLKFFSADHSISGIGIGVAGLAHPDKGTVEASPNLPYLKNFSFVKFFKSLGCSRVAVQNDAKCFALAELKLGSAKGYKHALCITLGTGIGSGIIINGELYGGARNGAGEIGHGFLTNAGDWESLYQSAKKRTKEGFGKKPGDHNFKKIAELTGKALAAASYTLDPEIIVLGGGVSRLYSKQFLPEAIKLAKTLLAPGRKLPKITISRLTSAPALGAALLVSK